MLLAANSLGSVSCSGWSLRGLLFFSVHAKNVQSDMYTVEAGSLLRDLFLLSPGAAITAILWLWLNLLIHALNEMIQQFACIHVTLKQSKFQQSVERQRWRGRDKDDEIKRTRICSIRAHEGSILSIRRIFSNQKHMDGREGREPVSKLGL